MGYLIRRQGLKPAFVWLPLTILNREAFYDHHLLYHLYLAVFAGVDPAVDGGRALTQAGKVASILMPGLAFLAIWWLLRGQQVYWAALWSLGLFAVSDAFLYRMSMARAQSASLLVLALGLHWLLQRRYRRLLPLGFVYVWLFNGFPLLLALAGLYTLATLLTERRLAWPALAFPAAGLVLGAVLNPYFPQDIAFMANHLLPKVGELETAVGNEWYPYQTWTVVQNSGLALAAFVGGALALGWREKRVDRPALAAFFLAVLLGVMFFKSRRFVEYFPAFALIFAALAVSPLVEGWLAGRPRWQRVGPLLFLALLAVPLGLTLDQARRAVAGAQPAGRYAEAALWLAENSPAGSLVFQTDWDDFPRLFFYNSHNVYTAGLDPTYLELQDEALFAEWVRITRGEVERPAMAIRQRFGASYVFSDLNHQAFLRVAAEDPALTEIYRDEHAVIFAVE